MSQPDVSVLERFSLAGKAALVTGASGGTRAVYGGMSGH